MLYSDAIYLLLAIVLFSSWPAEGNPLHLEHQFGLWLVKEILFIFTVFLSLKRSHSVASFLKAQSWLKALAFIFFASDVIVFGVSSFLYAHGLKEPFLLETVGMFFFLHYFIIIWFVSGFYEYRAPLGNLSVFQYISAQLRLLAPFIFPWFVVNLFFEIVELAFHPTHNATYELLYLSAFIMALTILVPPFMAKLWDCQPLPESRLRRCITGYLERERVRLREILLWQTFRGRLLTAGVIGIFARFRYLLLSPGLLAALEEPEILSVVAHEVGHLKRKHMFWLVIFFLFFSFLIYLALSPMFYALLAYFPRPELLADFFLPEAILSLGLIFAVLLYFRFLFGFFIRNFERQADLYCLESLGTAEGLIRSFKKIATLSGNTEDLPSWHHYSIRERIEFLRKATQDPALILQHHRKVRRALLVYLLVVALLCVGLTRIPQKDLRERAELNLALGKLQYKVSHFPEKEDLVFLASVCYRLGREAQALKYYERALKMDPHDSEILNNVAWILATAKDKRLRDPQRALKLALEATQARLLATHLDTLAEALYLNGRKGRACLYSLLALSKAQEDPLYYPNLEYYKQQKARFCHAQGQV